MSITINDPTQEATLLEYIDGKNRVKGAIKSVSASLTSLQQLQATFGEFLVANPDYQQYYSDSVAAIDGLQADFDTLETLAAQWLQTVEHIKSINPLF